jgi:hypothetical protein
METTRPRQARARDRRRRRALERFFDRELAPLAGRLREERRPLFPLGPDARAASYWIPRRRRAMAREDFEALGAATAEEAAELLARHWRAEGLGGLAALAPAMGALALRLRDLEDEAEEVSPFVYVMY